MPEIDLTVELTDEQMRRAEKLGVAFGLDVEEIVERFCQAGVSFLFSKDDNALLGMLHAQMERMKTGNA